ncbi:MAG: SirB2 family protein [Inhella sp.]
MEGYVLLKQAHVGLVALSLLGFAARGLGVLGGAGWPMRPGLRRTVVLVDSLLLAAGLGLWALLGWAPMPWLFAKFGWLMAYILLGSLALRRAQGRVAKVVCWLMALACAAQLVATARAHHPLGIFA